MIFRDLQRILEDWAPKELAWERDNAGPQIGARGKNIHRILVALDVTDEVIAEARRKRCDAIVTHHPLFFHPLRSIDTERRVGRLAAALVKSDIAVYAAHTNLDRTAGGVNAQLAAKLGLRSPSVLKPHRGGMKKIAVFVPAASVDIVADAMSGAGAGIIGDYESCSFRVAGTGTFRANERATPTVGTTGVKERVPEIRLEMLAPVWSVGNVLRAMRQAHPYEEVAYDVYDLDNESATIGDGMIGELPRSLPLRSFLSHVRRTLRASALRFATGRSRAVRRVAVCGGSGSDLLPAAIAAGADAFVTGDVRFHTFQEAEGMIALIDAGHFETERPVIPAIVGHLKRELRKRKFTATVHAAATSRNAVQYYH